MAYRAYRNKGSRINVLQQLCDNELPVDVAAVASELARRQIDTSSVRSAQQKAELLLQNMHQGIDGVVQIPPTDSSQVQRRVQCPSAEQLALNARVAVEKLMFQSDDDCTETMQKIWRPRRKAWTSVSPNSELIEVVKVKTPQGLINTFSKVIELIFPDV